MCVSGDRTCGKEIDLLQDKKSPPSIVSPIDTSKRACSALITTMCGPDTVASSEMPLRLRLQQYSDVEAAATIVQILDMQKWKLEGWFKVRCSETQRGAGGEAEELRRSDGRDFHRSTEARSAETRYVLQDFGENVVAVGIITIGRARRQ